MQYPIDSRAKRSLQNGDESQLKDETHIYIHPCRSLLHKLSTRRRGGAVRDTASTARGGENPCIYTIVSGIKGNRREMREKYARVRYRVAVEKGAGFLGTGLIVPSLRARHAELPRSLWKPPTAAVVVAASP
ncbi:unnamed protein product [Leptosia nina]|uniref:Uncharacterized protein n=1 Tax=Leptosia nina TaxID=320188 RepID=A0AAV1JL68_9NEOP